MFTGKKTKIVCTMGPASESEEVLSELIKNGMNIARFNFSHGSHESHKEGMDLVRRVADSLNANVAILLDTKGPEIRTGMLEGGEPVFLEQDTQVVVTADECVGTAERFSLDYKNLPKEVGADSHILIDDGLIELAVEHVEGNDIYCTVLCGGELGEHKGVNVPYVSVGLPAVTEQDKSDIIFGCQNDVDCICASFVRDAGAIHEIRELCKANGREDILIFAKIECTEAISNFDEILAAADGIMIARGDLGVEVATAVVPHLQKIMIEKCNRAYKPVITATQMLDSMIRNPRPTRAEATDVANAILDGTDCVMLSGETAKGRHPLEAVSTMTSICLETERYVEEVTTYYPREGIRNVNSSIGYAVSELAERVDAKVILCPTDSGRTARLVSAFRPQELVYAFSPMERTVRRCCFYWGVDAYLIEKQTGMTDTIQKTISTAREHDLVHKDDVVVITAGDPTTAPSDGDYKSSTNLVMVAQIP